MFLFTLFGIHMDPEDHYDPKHLFSIFNLMIQIKSDYVIGEAFAICTTLVFYLLS